jgi:hypothetical protein
VGTSQLYPDYSFAAAIVLQRCIGVIRNTLCNELLLLPAYLFNRMFTMYIPESGEAA